MSPLTLVRFAKLTCRPRMTCTPSMLAGHVVEHGLSNLPSLCRSCWDWEDLAVILVGMRLGATAGFGRQSKRGTPQQLRPTGQWIDRHQESDRVLASACGSKRGGCSSSRPLAELMLWDAHEGRIHTNPAQVISKGHLADDISGADLAILKFDRLRLRGQGRDATHCNRADLRRLAKLRRKPRVRHRQRCHSSLKRRAGQTDQNLQVTPFAKKSRVFATQCPSGCLGEMGGAPVHPWRPFICGFPSQSRCRQYPIRSPPKQD
jgi:hypothetical protein